MLKIVTVYLDDIIIFSKNKENHLRHVEQVLSAMNCAGVTLKLSKCSFFTDRVKYLRHIIKPGCLEIDTAHVKSLREAKPPKTKKELRSFLGVCNVYRRFVKNYAMIAAPLTDLLEDRSPDLLNELDTSEMKAFHVLIKAITKPIVLALPIADARFSLDTDASDGQIGCAFFHEHEGKRRPVGYFSRTLTKPERNYSVSEKECLGIIWAVMTLRPYLLGVGFDLNTDHSSLRWLMNITDPSGRLLRWRLCLSKFDFAINYKR